LLDLLAAFGTLHVRDSHTSHAVFPTTRKVSDVIVSCLHFGALFAITFWMATCPTSTSRCPG
jgi:hypothetical protein